MADDRCANEDPPEAIIALLNSELRTIFSDANVSTELSSRGLEPRISGLPDELKEFVAADRSPRLP